MGLRQEGNRTRFEILRATKMIRIYSRHCKFSRTSQHKERPEWFSKPACFRNLVRGKWDTHPDVEMRICFDGTEEELLQSYIGDVWTGDVTCMPFYSEAKGFAYIIWSIKEDSTLEDDDIVYFCEDDYLHRGDWIKILKEGFTIPNVNMVTLYDHADKYCAMYEGLTSSIYSTDTCHWRTTPSTCHTFGVKASCIREHYDTWVRYSGGGGTSVDHEKFIDLQRKGCKLVSSIPGYATHVQPPWLSPMTNWEAISNHYSDDKLYK